MAAFPAALVPAQSSKISPDRGLRTYVTEGGGVRGRVQYAETVFQLQLVYEDLTDAEVTLIEDHFAAAPTGQHTVAVRGVTYDVVYQAQPAIIEYRGVLRTYRVDFIGTKQ